MALGSPDPDDLHRCLDAAQVSWSSSQVVMELTTRKALNNRVVSINGSWRHSIKHIESWTEVIGLLLQFEETARLEGHYLVLQACSPISTGLFADRCGHSSIFIIIVAFIRP